MYKQHPDSLGAQRVYQLPDAVKTHQSKNRQQAEQLLTAFRNGDPQAIAEFHKRHPDGKKPDFSPSLLGARLLVSSNVTIVKRLSLEKLKKESKDLLKQLRRGSTEALERLQRHHGEKANKVKLADAQLIIARENSLPSWPKLKAHVELMNHATGQIGNAHAAPDADLKTLHIRCGNDIKEALKTCGFVGDFLEVSNPLPQGPVPHFDPLDTFIQTRTQFIVRSYGDDVPVTHHIENAAEEIRQIEETLRHLPERYERIVMWYEHDSYDQLSKAYVLAHLAELNLKGLLVECIQIDRFPGVKKFIGIGQLCQMPEAMIALWPQREPITQAITAFGARCWQAFTAADPTTLWQITQETEAPLPLMQTAMRRVLMELPWTGNGLSLTEHLVLEILAEEGPMRPGAIFNLLMTELEPLPFLGDIMLLSILRPLWQSEHPAIIVLDEFSDEHPMRKSMLAITELGRSLLKCESNWLMVNKDSSNAERYVGGIHIEAGKKNWHWSAEQNRPTMI